MKSFIFIISLLVQINATAGEIYKVFGDGVFDIKWGQSVEDIQKVFPSSKLEKYGDIIQLEVKDGRKVFGISRDKDAKINFAFDSEKRLIGVAVYFDDESFSPLLLKLNTIFGEYVKQGQTGVFYVQWQQDNSVTITLTLSKDTIFSIGYYGLDKPDISKDELGF